MKTDLIKNVQKLIYIKDYTFGYMYYENYAIAQGLVFVYLWIIYSFVT